MKIVKSKYSSTELREIYEKVEKNVRYDLVKKEDSLFFGTVVTLFLLYVLSGALSKIVSWLDPVFYCLFALSCLFPLTFFFVEDLWLRKLEKKGYLFQNPLNEFSFLEYADLLAIGEKMLEFLESHPNIKSVQYKGEELILIDSETIKVLNENEPLHLEEWMWEVAKEEDFYDFSVFDKELEEWVEMAEKIVREGDCNAD